MRKLLSLVALCCAMALAFGGFAPRASAAQLPTGLLALKTDRVGAVQDVRYRCWWRDGCGNSFLVSIDGSDPIEMSTGNYKRWHWVPVGPLFKLSAGVHTLKIANSEDGAKLDAVFLTSNIGRVPVGRIEQLTPQALVR